MCLIEIGRNFAIVVPCYILTIIKLVVTVIMVLSFLFGSAQLADRLVCSYISHPNKVMDPSIYKYWIWQPIVMVLICGVILFYLP